MTPLVCHRCGSPIAIVSVITEPDVIDEILRHIQDGGGDDPFEPRGPPDAAHSDRSATH